jgi:hypothetical protein
MKSLFSPSSSVRIAVIAAGCVVLFSCGHKQAPAAQTSVQAASAQAVQPASAQAVQPAPQQMIPFTAPDGSASVNVPAGYKVTQSGGSIIELAGPNGEHISLGGTMAATNGPFVPGLHGRGLASVSMPYGASFTEKLTMIIQQADVLNGNPVPQVTINSVTPIMVLPKLGQCGTFTGSATSPSGPMIGIGTLCSLPIDFAGAFKNFILLASAPAAESAQFTPIAQSVLSSFSMPVANLQNLLAPFTQMAGRPKVVMDAVTAQCFQLSVLRATPSNLLPQTCGGSAID